MIILPEDKKIISLLPAEDAQQVLLALFSEPDETLDLTPLANMAYTVIKGKSDRITERKSKAGKLGGVSKNNQGAQNQADGEKDKQSKQTVTEQADGEKTTYRTSTVSVSDTVTKEGAGAAAPTPSDDSKKDVRHKHGTYGWVKLSKSEHKHLISDYGEKVALFYINLVDEKAQQTGNKNKWRDWNLVVRKAIREKWGGEPPPERWKSLD